MKSRVSDPTESHEYPGWWEVEVVVRGEVAMAYGQTQWQASNQGEGKRMEMESIHAKAEKEVLK